jgi:hypothetical protein
VDRLGRRSSGRQRLGALTRRVASSLRVILAEALEFNRNEARAAAESGFEEEYLSV